MNRRIKTEQPDGLKTFAEIAVQLNISKQTLWKKIKPIRHKLKQNGSRKRLYSPSEVKTVLNHVKKSL